MTRTQRTDDCLIPWRHVMAVAYSAMMVTTVQGLTYPLLSLVLYGHGMTDSFVGFSAAMTPLGMTLCALSFPFVLRRSGARLLAIFSISGIVACLLLLGAIENTYVWLALRLSLGILLTSLFIVTDIWMNQLAPPTGRGRILGLYSMLTSVGFAVGPFLLLLFGTQGWPPFLGGAVCGALSLVPLIARQAGEFPAATAAHSDASVLSFIPKAPLLLIGVGAAALTDQAAMAMLPVYMLRSGWNVADATSILFVMTLGCVVLQYPVGWLADHVGRRSVQIGCALVAAVGAALLPLCVHAHVYCFPLVFLWGGAYFGIYTLSLVELGARFADSELIAGNATFAAVWGIGGLLGMPFIGGSMQFFGPLALPLTFALLYIALLCLIHIDKRR